MLCELQAHHNHLGVHLILHPSIWIDLDTETLPEYRKRRIILHPNIDIRILFYRKNAKILKNILYLRQYDQNHAKNAKVSTTTLGLQKTGLCLPISCLLVGIHGMILGMYP